MKTAITQHTPGKTEHGIHIKDKVDIIKICKDVESAVRYIVKLRKKHPGNYGFVPVKTIKK